MNILLGSHGTGKSTLLAELKKDFSSLYVTDGFSRPVKIIKDKLLINQREEQIIINELSKWNWENNINNPFYMSTRSIVDCYIYSKVLGFKDLAKDCIEDFYRTKHNKIKFFYIPIEFDLEDDGVRFIDKKFQKKVDLEIKMFFFENFIDPIVVKGSVEERISIISKHIKL